MRGEETDPALLSTISGGYRNSLVSTLGVQQRPGDLTKGPVSPGTWWSNQGSCVSRCWVWGLYGSPSICLGQAPVPRGPISAVYLQCVLSPLRFPISELRVLPWLTCGPFSSVHLVVIWGQVTLSELLLRVLLSEKLWWCRVNIITSLDHHSLVSPRPSSCNIICNWNVILHWDRFDINILF